MVTMAEWHLVTRETGPRHKSVRVLLEGGHLRGSAGRTLALPPGLTSRERELGCGESCIVHHENTYRSDMGALERASASRFEGERGP